MMDSNHTNNSSATRVACNKWNEALHTQIKAMERIELDSSVSSFGDASLDPRETPRKVSAVSLQSSCSPAFMGSRESLGMLLGTTCRDSSKRKLPGLGSNLWNLGQTHTSTRTVPSGMPASPRTRRCIKGIPPMNQSSNCTLVWSSSFSTQSSGSLPKSTMSSTNSSSLSSSHGTSSSFRNERMVIQIAQRSSSKEVKSMLTQLAEEGQLDEDMVEAHCGTLAQLVSDSYYQVVVSKYGGVQILCHVMKAFPLNTNILESCCSCLERIPHHQHLQLHGGAILKECLELHPQSIHVQSAACQALAAMLEHRSDALILPEGLDDLLDLAMHMYLTPRGRQAVQRVRQLLSERERAMY